MSEDVDIDPDVDDALFAAAFELAAEGGWRRARMVDIAARAGVSADQARARFRYKISFSIASPRASTRPSKPPRAAARI